MSELPPIPSRQEMFDRAWNGLKSQGFERCMWDPDDRYHGGQCAYSSPDGTKHCAWGWVDPEGLAGYQGNSGVYGCPGLAERLDAGDRNFASRLQRAHDGAESPAEMEQKLRSLAADCGLVVPS